MTQERIKQIEELMDMEFKPEFQYFESKHKYHLSKLMVDKYGIRYGQDGYNEYCENACDYETAITLDGDTIKQIITIMEEE